MNKSALIIDDHLVNRVVLEKFFKRLDFTIEGASDIPTAIRKYRQAQVSLVTLDLHLPKLGGYDFLDYLRTHHGQSGLPVPPVFVITGDATVRASDISLRCASGRLFFKPVDLGVIAAALAEIGLCESAPR